MVTSIRLQQLAAVTETDCSRVGAGVDGQVPGYPPEDLLLRLPPVFTLQQLFVRAGQVKLCEGPNTEGKTNNNRDIYRKLNLQAVAS